MKKETFLRWKENQSVMDIHNIEKEYVYENETMFILVFDSENKIINYEIEKSEITTVQDIITLCIKINKTTRVNNRILKELYEKALSYIFTLRMEIKVATQDDYNKYLSI